MAEDKPKVVKIEKKKKVVDPVAASVDVASQEMIARATELNVETIFGQGSDHETV